MFSVYDKERREPVGKEGGEEAEPTLAGQGHTGLADTGDPGQEAGEPAAGQIPREVERGAVCGLVFR